MHEHAQTARAMQRSIKENLTRVQQASETCRAQVHLATALEGELTLSTMRCMPAPVGARRSGRSRRWPRRERVV